VGIDRFRGFVIKPVLNLVKTTVLICFTRWFLKGGSKMLKKQPGRKQAVKVTKMLSDLF